MNVDNDSALMFDMLTSGIRETVVELFNRTFVSDRLNNRDPGAYQKHLWDTLSSDQWKADKKFQNQIIGYVHIVPRPLEEKYPM